MRRRKLFFAVLAICFVNTSCSTTDEVANGGSTLSFGCQDTVLVGRLKNNRDYQHVEIEDDILGHGWMTGTVRVHRIVTGAKLADSVPVRYFGHTYLREDRSFMFVLTPKADGVYQVSDQRLMSDKPRPISEC